eukprot:2865440-Amphidinium_carterae.1
MLLCVLGAYMSELPRMKEAVEEMTYLSMTDPEIRGSWAMILGGDSGSQPNHSRLMNLGFTQLTCYTRTHGHCT